MSIPIGRGGTAGQMKRLNPVVKGNIAESVGCVHSYMCIPVTFSRVIDMAAHSDERDVGRREKLGKGDELWRRQTALHREWYSPIL